MNTKPKPARLRSIRNRIARAFHILDKLISEYTIIFRQVRPVLWIGERKLGFP